MLHEKVKQTLKNIFILQIAFMIKHVSFVQIGLTIQKDKLYKVFIPLKYLDDLSMNDVNIWLRSKNLIKQFEEMKMVWYDTLNQPDKQ